MHVITTQRLILRHWRESDLAPFRALNADPQVMEYFPEMLDAEQSDALAAYVQKRIEEQGFGFWAVEVPGVTDFIGMIGVSAPRFETHFAPCIEIGWRLSAAHWGQGYATEAAQASVRFAFERLNTDEVVSFTVPANIRSRRVMERIGMKRHEHDDFDHPSIASGHALQRHVLYRINRSC